MHLELLSDDTLRGVGQGRCKFTVSDERRPVGSMEAVHYLFFHHKGIDVKLSSPVRQSKLNVVAPDGSRTRNTTSKARVLKVHRLRTFHFIDSVQRRIDVTKVAVEFE